MRFIALTKRTEKKGAVLVNCNSIVAIEDNRRTTDVKDFAWTNVWLANGLKLEVVETEKEIFDKIWVQERG